MPGNYQHGLCEWIYTGSFFFENIECGKVSIGCSLYYHACIVLLYFFAE